ncbi:MAG: sensor histidine kinase [Candidatus Cloacimonetes bacterium]|nr:sensor histidine kinase [Candidatus Cloacimonadota bacterium]MCF7812856.1 sensor histidine kinase [Candidatus Cloacimonadota bacterium]MCF7867068.1 sensor histidine kinase [Candidatus Cloacimonadota bacterium]MCF7882612.1 sensor histidine kinase [Candidatus Cloacimonadota bacterium]
MVRKLPSHKKKLIISLSVLLIIGFLTTSLVSYFVALSSLRSQISSTELPLTSDNVYSEIQRDLFRPIIISSMMANDTFLQNWIAGGEKNITEITNYLSAIVQKYNFFTSFFVSETTRIYYQSKGILKIVQEDEERDKWYFRVKIMKEEYEINIDPDMANNDVMTVFINYKVFDNRGNFLGAAGVGLEIKTLVEFLDKYSEKYNRNIYLVDNDGNIVLHNNSLPDTYQKIHQMNGINALVDSLLSSTRKMLKFNRDKSTVHLNTRFIPELNMHLFVEKIENKTMKNINNALIINLVLFIVITTIIILLTTITINIYQKFANKQQIEIYEKNTELQNKNEDLEQLIQEKSAALEQNNLLMREMNHRVKNNLATIQSLLRIQSSEVKDDTSRMALKESESRLKSITHLHQMLSRKIDLSKISVTKYVQNLVNDVLKSFDVNTDKIRVEMEVEDIELDMNVLIPFALILNELLTNSLKYAFPDNEGKINIFINSVDDMNCQLTFIDNGIGLPENFNIKETDSLGTQIVSMLVSQIHGDLSFNSKKNKGTEFFIKFPTKK